MKTQEAKELGVRIATLAQAGQMTQAYALLAPGLAERTLFPLLGHFGESIGDYLLDMVNAFLEHVGSGKTEGGWLSVAGLILSWAAFSRVLLPAAAAFSSLAGVSHQSVAWRVLWPIRS